MSNETSVLNIYNSEFTQGDAEQVKSILEKHDFGIHSSSYQENIISTTFPSNNEMMTKVDKVEKEIREQFTNYDIERSESYSNTDNFSRMVSFVTNIHFD